MVERFTVYPGVTYHSGQPHQNIKGEYVRFSDYKALQKELAEARAAVESEDQWHQSLQKEYERAEHHKARADTLARRVEVLEADNERLTKERDRERKHVARLMRDLQHNRERAEKAEATIRAAPLIQTALTHASFALDGIVALDDEDMGKDGGSATCQQAKHTVDRALAALTGERP